MPKGPKGQKRPADVISNAVHVMRIATGEIDESGVTDERKNKAAVELGRKGGVARAKKLSAKRREAIARAGALARWNKKRTMIQITTKRDGTGTYECTTESEF